ncbi:MAG: phage antirepressor KilAC domain-containing protein [Selenomonadaceae bacterium]|nr:phage antirepressor KilAC domain-containing protein [Selenomonadaceae bacterium]
MKLKSREALIANALIAANEVITELNNKVAELLPKATAYDAVIEKFDNISWRDLCNELKSAFGVKENEVRAKLINEGWIYKVNSHSGRTKYKPYTETLLRELMVVKDILCNDDKIRQHYYFTYKGREKLIDWFAPVVVPEDQTALINN